MEPEHDIEATPATPADTPRGLRLLREIREHAARLGLSQIGVSDLELGDAEAHLVRWLEQGMHGRMEYMQRHGLARVRPRELLPGTLRVITARLDYLPPDAPPGWRAREWQRLQQPEQAVVSLYARGRDYHKVLRHKLAQLAGFIAERASPIHRACRRRRYSARRSRRVESDNRRVLSARLAGLLLPVGGGAASTRLTPTTERQT